MDRSDANPAEKYRKILEAYEIENEYGRTIEAYEGEMDINGETRTVSFCVSAAWRWFIKRSMAKKAALGIKHRANLLILTEISTVNCAALCASPNNKPRPTYWSCR